jgi:hypothetical protein
MKGQINPQLPQVIATSTSSSLFPPFKEILVKLRTLFTHAPIFVIPAPAFAGVNLSPRKRGAGIYLYKLFPGFPLEFTPHLDAGRE